MHEQYPDPQCPICNRYAQSAGYESVADYLASRDPQPEVAAA